MIGDGGSGMLRSLAKNQGFSLAEVLVALMLLTVGFVGVVGALGAHSGGLGDASSRGLAAITRGNYVSTATMLAQQRMEQLKQLTFQLAPPIDQFGTGEIPTGFADEAMGQIPDENGQFLRYRNFGRQVRMQTGVPAANIKTITVTVNFRLPTQSGSNQEAVAMSTLVAATP